MTKENLIPMAVKWKDASWEKKELLGLRMDKQFRDCLKKSCSDQQLPHKEIRRIVDEEQLKGRELHKRFYCYFDRRGKRYEEYKNDPHLGDAAAESTSRESSPDGQDFPNPPVTRSDRYSAITSTEDSPNLRGSTLGSPRQIGLNTLRRYGSLRGSPQLHSLC